MKKYKLTNETIECNGVTLHRIEALMDFADVKKGDKGGFVQSEDNLSHNGDCWVCDYAKVYGNAMVYGNAFVFGSAKVFGNAFVTGNAKVYGFAEVYGDAKVRGNAEVF